MKNTKHISVGGLLISNLKHLLLGLILLAVNRLSSMVIPTTGKYLIDNVIVNKDLFLLKNIILIVALSIIIQSVTSYFVIQILNIRAQEQIAILRAHFYNRIIHFPLSYFKNGRSGEITSRILTDFESLRIIIGSGLVEVFGGFLSIIFALILMLVVSVKLTFLILAPILIFSLILYLIFKKQKHHFKNKKLVQADTAANLTESFMGIKLIKGFMNHDSITRLMNRSFNTLFETIKATLVAKNLLLSLAILFLGATSILVMWFGGTMVISQEITVGELTSFTLYLALMIVPFYQLTKTSTQITDALASIERINETLQIPTEIVNETAPISILKGAISFVNVSFSFEENQVLKNISFNIEPNTVNAIIGKSGSGKTTLTDLIAGFYQPNSGQILIDGSPLSQLNINHYRHQLGFVFQESFLFNISIHENILLGKPSASLQEVNEAMIAANVSEFVDKLPHGLETIVGENGSKLSMGQKQRIAIARVFLSDPKVLILDEITSNLDPENEKLISESISRLMENRTIIIIAHRLNTIKNAHQVFLLENGALIGSGKLNDLVTNHKAYFEFMEFGS